MLRTAYRLLALLDGAELRRLVLVLIVAVADGLLQAAGIASIMPFIAVLADPSVAESSRFFGLLKAVLPGALQDHLVLTTGVLALTMLILSNAASVLNYWLSLRLFNEQSQKLSTRLLAMYLDRELLDFNRHKVADMSTTVLSEVERVVINTMMAGVGLIADSIVTVAIVALLLLVDPWITLWAALTLGGGYVMVHLLIGREVSRLGKEYAVAESSVFATLAQALALFKEIKIAGVANVFVRAFAQPSRELVRISNRYEILRFVPAQVIEVLAFTLILGVAIFVSSAYEGTSFNVIAVIAFFAFAAYRLVPVLKSMLDGVEEIVYGAGVVGKILSELEQAPPDAGAAETSAGRLPVRHEIRLEGVCFQYPGARLPVLNRLDVSIPAGKLTCIVGPSGAGKSTLLDVLLALIFPQEGRCLIDGEELAQGNRRAWQGSVGYVPQQVQLLNGTLAENIALAESTIDSARAQAAAEAAGIHRLAMEQLPGGYDCVIGEGGQSLSSGERQRVGIARALYRQPSVLLLDEATNELDAATEARVLEHLVGLKGVTIVFATHKQSVKERADAVIELQGRLS